MNGTQDFGGFFPLEVGRVGHMHPHALAFATACGALRMVLRTLHDAQQGPTKIWMPTFLCPEVEQAVVRERPDLAIHRYSLDGCLVPVGCAPARGDIVYRVNLFGLVPVPSPLDGVIVIADNVHAIFAPPVTGATTLYSARKFFGVPDGAYLYTDAPVNVPPPLQSYDRCQHLLKRHDLSSEAAYPDFRTAEQELAAEPPAGMSKLAQVMLGGIDHATVRARRRDNFLALHDVLGPSNSLSALIAAARECADFMPFSYPYLCDGGAALRAALVRCRVFVPLLWPEVATRSEATAFERHLALDTVHLPVDQRYTPADMVEVLKLLHYCRAETQPGKVRHS